MMISRKGHVITEVHKDKLLTLSLTHLSVTDITSGEEIKHIGIEGISHLNFMQMTSFDDHIFIFNLENEGIIHIDENWEIHQAFFSRRFPSYKFLIIKLDDDKLMLYNNLYFIAYKLSGKILGEIGSLWVRKYYLPIRLMEKNLFGIFHNILDYRNNKVLYHFHGDKKVIYDDEDFGKPYYLHDDRSISRIGIYDINLNQKQVEFIAPEAIAFGGWFEWTEDITLNQSALKGFTTSDKIILCYPKTIYVMDFNGKILQKMNSGEGKRYTDVNLLNGTELLVSEFSEADQITEMDDSFYRRYGDVCI